jgi:tetratricopeptide (TPR) repeat protein
MGTTLRDTTRLSLLNKANPKTGDYPSSIASTWSLNFQEVEQNPISADILRVSAFLSPDAIPFELLTIGASQLGSAIANALSNSNDPLALSEVLEPLARYSLIRLDVDTQTYSIHRMVQEVVKNQMDTDQQAEWTERVVRAVAHSFPKLNYQTWSRFKRLVPHALLCAEYIDHWSLVALEARDLLYLVGEYFYQLGQYWEAGPLFKNALVICEQLLGSEHLETLGIVQRLAFLYLDLGKYEEAEPMYLRALEARERLLGSEYPDTLHTVNNLAFFYALQGNYEQAEMLYQRALLAREQALGSEHPHTLHTINNLANLYLNQDNYEEAESLFQRALEARERVLGQDHPDTLSTMNNLALLYWKQGKNEEAEQLYQRALEARERVLGLRHPDTAKSLESLALLYGDQAKYEEAEPLYQQALAIYKQVLGADHPETKRAQNNYALHIQKMKQKVEAEPSKPKNSRKQPRK